MNANTINRRLRQLSIVVLAIAAAALAATPVSAQNFINDPSFESNPLIGIGPILGPPYTTGAWGAENGSIVGPQSGIVPAAGALMHRMDDDGLIATQSFQLVDVTALGAQIDAGLVSLNANMLYNVPQDVLAGVGALYVNFYNAAHASVPPVTMGTSSVLDNNLGTWQNLALANTVPVNTRFLLFQGAFSNATMVNSAGAHRPGYVDGARLTLTVVPEPSTIALGALALLGAVWVGRRR
jgi:hypothetical protein